MLRTTTKKSQQKKRLVSFMVFLDVKTAYSTLYAGDGEGDDAVTDNSVLLNVNIVDESISGCNDVYLTCHHFSDVSA